MSSKTYFSAAETARLIRKALKQAFPTTKFYVRSSRGTVDIYWVDGPTTNQVRGITDSYSNKEFDGMIDLAYYSSSWLLPDGSATVGNSPGTSASGGVYAPYETAKPCEGALLVCFNCYVFTERSRSLETLQGIVNALAEQTGLTPPPIKLQSFWVAGKDTGEKTAYLDVNPCNSDHTYFVQRVNRYEEEQAETETTA